MQKYFIVTVLFIILLGFGTKSYAATELLTSYNEDVHLTKAESPYKVGEGGLTMRFGSSITIDPGVTVLFAPEASLVVEGGEVKIGDKNSIEKVIFDLDKDAVTRETDGLGWRGLEFKNNTSEINFLEIKNSTSPVYINSATSTIYNMLLNGNDNIINEFDQNGIYATKSYVNVSSSSISHFKNAGIIFQASTGSINDSLISQNNIGFMYDKAPVPLPMVFNIKKIFTKVIGGFVNKAFAEEVSYFISGLNNSFIENTVHVKNLDDNTTLDFRNNFWGDNTGPKLGTVIGNILTVPFIKRGELQPCCSSVVFIPGFEGTRLSKGNNQLWEPNRHADVDKLQLDENGVSKDEGISVGKTIERTNIGFGLFDKNIYKSFFVSLNSLVASGTIKSWQDMPYDWRLDLPVDDGFIKTIEDTASSSMTGKVSLVGHSNGGLMVKKITQKLKEMSKENLVDKIIFVATPHIGAPSSIGAILSGEEQSLGPLGIYMNKDTAKNFGKNLVGAYNLLPSTQYFSKALVSPLSFEGADVSSFDKFTDFNKKLLGISENNHTALDFWNPPASSSVFEIAGINLPTTKRAQYSKTGHNIVKDKQGDGVVPLISSLFAQAYSYLFDISKYQKDVKGDYSHAYILEANPILGLLSNILTNSKTDTTSKYISTTTKDITDTFELRQYSVHSPISIDLYDRQGNHTGLVKSPNPESDLYFVENNIPGSVYEEIDEGKYITLGDDIPVKVSMQGTGLGTFTFEIKDQFTNNSSSTMVFEDIPVTDQTLASIDTGNQTSSSTLLLDTDGDGKTDFALKPNVEIDPVTYLGIIKKTIVSFNLKPLVERQLIRQIDAAIKALSKDKSKNATQRLKKLAKEIGAKKWKAKKLQENQKTELLKMINYTLDLI